MNDAFYIGATGLRAHQQALEVVANNVSNVNTTGFKRAEARFSALVGGPAPLDLQAAPAAGLAGVDAGAPVRDFRQGEVRMSGDPLDLAINGRGFIEVAGPDGAVHLWRGGRLSVNADGFLAAAGGMPLKGGVSVPAGATLTIAADGAVTAKSADGALEEIGRIELVVVDDEAALTEVGPGLYRAEADSPLRIDAGEGGVLVQGGQEASNVELAQEMVAMLMAQRAFAANAQVVQAGDQLMAIANDLRR
jgi:flagellar basal-body rod protein FlgG